MLHHEESPEKPQYNMATSLFLDKPPILPNPPFLAKTFINFEKVEPPPPLYQGGGVRTMPMATKRNRSWTAGSSRRTSIIYEAFH